jgi:hypothetical protein
MGSTETRLSFYRMPTYKWPLEEWKAKFSSAYIKIQVRWMVR